jgi:hypothetical protein
MCAIGTIVSILRKTDLIVFLINPNVRTEPMKLAPELGLPENLFFQIGVFLHHHLNQIVFLWGLQLSVMAPLTRFLQAHLQAVECSFQCNVGIVPLEGRERKLTDNGDCGALFLDTEGKPLHHVLHFATDSNGFESFSVPLMQVMSNLGEAWKLRLSSKGAQSVLLQSTRNRLLHSSISSLMSASK